MNDHHSFDLLKKIYVFMLIYEGKNPLYISKVTNLTHSSIADHISSLEQYLGFKLFEKEGTTYKKNAQGDNFYTNISKIIQINTLDN